MKLPVTLRDISSFSAKRSHTVDYPGHWWQARTSILSEGEMVFSPVSKTPLTSLDYRSCFGIAWVSQATQMNVLAHICTGTLWKESFSSVFLRRERDNITKILDAWVVDGGFSHHDEMGIFGSCIFPQNPNSYHTNIDLLLGIMTKILPGTPQILSAPLSHGSLSHARVDGSWLSLYQTRQSIVFPQSSHFTRGQILGRIRLLTS